MRLLIILAMMISRDIVGHPRDIPDIGAYEYSEKTVIMDTKHYIFNNWLDSTKKGDFNHDGITNLIDYAILVDYWDNK